MYVEFEYWEVVGYRFEYSDMKMILHRPSMDVDGWKRMMDGWMGGWKRMIDDEYWGKETKKPHHNHNPTFILPLAMLCIERGCVYSDNWKCNR